MADIKQNIQILLKGKIQRVHVIHAIKYKTNVEIPCLDISMC